MSLPGDWTKITIGEVVDFQGGTQPPKSTFVFEPTPGYVRMIQTRDYRTNKYITYIPQGLAKNHCDVDDVLIGRYGPPVFQIFRGLTGAYNVALIKAVPDDARITKSFLYIVLLQDSLFNLIDGLSRRSAGQAGVDMTALRSYPLFLPPLQEQYVIISLIDVWDRGIRQLTDLIAAKLRFKHGLMQQLLTGQRRFKGCLEEWQPAQLRDVTTECEERNRGQLSPESVMAVTKAEGIVPMRERTIAADIGRYLIVRKDWFAYNPMRINIGSIARWSGDKAIVVSPDYVVFRCNEPNRKSPGIDPDYLDHLRRSDIWVRFVTAAGNGSVRVRIYYSDLGHLKFKLPGPTEQRKIANFLNKADREIDLLRKELEALKQQKKGMMQKLLTGEVRVKLPKGVV